MVFMTSSHDGFFMDLATDLLWKSHGCLGNDLLNLGDLRPQRVMWTLVEWFAPVTTVVRYLCTINHSEIGVCCTNLALSWPGASHCTVQHPLHQGCRSTTWPSKTSQGFPGSKNSKGPKGPMRANGSDQMIQKAASMRISGVLPDTPWFFARSIWNIDTN
jgi:hypothetical protein